MEFFKNEHDPTNNPFPSNGGGFPNNQVPPNGFPSPNTNPFGPPPIPNPNNPMGGFPNNGMPPSNNLDVGNLPGITNNLPQEDINNIDIKNLNYLEIIMGYLKEDKKHLIIMAILFFVGFLTILYGAYSVYFIFWEFESWLHFFNEVTYIKALLIGFFNLLLTMGLMKIGGVLKYKKTPEVLFIFYSIVFGGAFTTLLIMGKISIYLFFIDFVIVLIGMFFFNYIASYKINGSSTEDLLKQVNQNDGVKDLIQGAAKKVVPTDLDVSLPQMDINIGPGDNFQGQPQQEVSQEETKKANILAKIKESLQEFIEENSINHILINEHKKRIYGITIQEEPSTQLGDYDDVILPTEDEIINKTLENKGLYINNEEELDDEKEEESNSIINNEIINNSEEDYLNDIIEENTEKRIEEDVKEYIENEEENFGSFNIDIKEENKVTPKIDDFIEENEEDTEGLIPVAEDINIENKNSVKAKDTMSNNLLDDISDIFPNEIENTNAQNTIEEPNITKEIKAEDLDIGDFIDKEEKENLLDEIVGDTKEKKEVQPKMIKKKEKKSLNDNNIPDISKIDISDLDF